MTTTTNNVLATAKALARQQIDTDGRGQPVAMRRSLETLYDRLFDPDFDAGEVAAEPAARRQFRFTFGVSPKGYRDRLLFDIARQMVCYTEAPITDIAVALGFAEPEAFSRWFKYRAGLSPMKLREEQRRPAEKRPPQEPQSPPEDVDFPLSPREWRRVVLGAASREIGLAVIRHIYEMYPEAFEEPPPTE